MKTINKVMLKSGVDAAKSLKADLLFIFVDALEDTALPENLPKSCKLVAVTKNLNNEVEDLQRKLKTVIDIPNIDLGRLGLIKLTIALALSQNHIKFDDKLVFLSGNANTQVLDTLLSIEMGSESEVITAKNISGISDTVKPEVFEHILSLAVELANKGREGKPVGTIFVVGDQDRVMQLSKQMIINPFRGYDEDERNILNPQLKETIREFSAIDGAFVIGDDGTVITAGRYLGAAHDEDNIPRGLGSRHIAAAGITALTNAIAIVISESTGDVRIFKNGKILMEIEKP